MEAGGDDEAVPAAAPDDRDALRAAARARRRAVPAAERATRDAALRRHLAGLVPAGGTVCAYVPDDGEPGGAGLPAFLAGLGARVLLPLAGALGPLDWAEYTDDGHLRPGRFGIPVPDSPALGPDAIAEAALVLVPAVAVDRRGARLGRGGGYYDRSLGLAAPATRRVALVDDENLLERVPERPHDLRVDAVVTPSAALAVTRSSDWHSPG